MDGSDGSDGPEDGYNILLKMRCHAQKKRLFGDEKKPSGIDDLLRRYSAVDTVYVYTNSRIVQQTNC